MQHRFYNLIKLIAILLLYNSLQPAYGQENRYAGLRPYILFIMSDDHAFQALSAYSDKLIKTPNIDKIAEQGIIYNKAFVTNSICAPSRAAT